MTSPLAPHQVIEKLRAYTKEEDAVESFFNLSKCVEPFRGTVNEGDFTISRGADRKSKKSYPSIKGTVYTYQGKTRVDLVYKPKLSNYLGYAVVLFFIGPRFFTSLLDFPGILFIGIAIALFYFLGKNQFIDEYNWAQSLLSEILELTEVTDVHNKVSEKPSSNPIMDDPVERKPDPIQKKSEPVKENRGPIISSTSHDPIERSGDKKGGWFKKSSKGRYDQSER